MGKELWIRGRPFPWQLTMLCKHSQSHFEMQGPQLLL